MLEQFRKNPGLLRLTPKGTTCFASFPVSDGITHRIPHFLAVPRMLPCRRGEKGLPHILPDQHQKHQATQGEWKIKLRASRSRELTRNCELRGFSSEGLDPRSEPSGTSGWTIALKLWLTAFTLSSTVMMATIHSIVFNPF